MSDPRDKNSAGGEQGDRLSEALKRAEAAVRKSEQPGDPAPSSGEIELGDSKPSPSFGEIELGGSKPSSSSAKTEPGGGSKPPSFGEIDLGSSDSSELELDAAAKTESPKGKKPIIAKPALLQDEDYGDDGWAEGKQKPAGQPQPEDKPAGEQMKVRRPAPNVPAPGAPAASQPVAPQAAPVAPPPVEREGPSIRVSQAGPKKDWGPTIKIMLIVILVVGLIGGGIFGYLKWQESVKAEEQAQLDALDQGSLDALKKEALRKEQMGS